MQTPDSLSSDLTTDAPPSTTEDLIRLAPLLGLLGSLVFLVLVILPLSGQVRVNGKQLEQLRQEEAELTQLNRAQAQLGQVLRQLQQRHRQLSQRLAPADFLDRVLMDLVARSRSVPGLTLRRYTYQPAGTRLVEDDRYGQGLKGRLVENTVQLETAGSFAASLIYLRLLEQGSPHLLLSNYQISLGQEGVDRHRVLTRVKATAVGLVTPAQAALLRRQQTAQPSRK